MASSTDTAWDDQLLHNPHAAADKRTRVQKMFAAIAPSYDLNNRLHSFWQDQRWRKKAVKLANLKPTDVVVDVACGTGDLSIRFAKALFQSNPRRPVSMNEGRDPDPAPISRATRAARSGSVTGIDFTYEMLPIAHRKADTVRLSIKATDALCRLRAHVPLDFIQGDALALPLPDACCDVVSIAFGIRNVQDPVAAIREFFRILRPGGRLIILEFSQPTNPLIRWCNDIYCSKIMPRTATWLSRDRTGAYKYLPQSVKTFIGREDMMNQMRQAGFTDVSQHPFTFGVCVCYRGVKAD